MKKVLEFLQEHWMFISPALLEIGLRLFPTEKNVSILRFVIGLLDKLIPNRKSNGGTFKTRDILMPVFLMFAFSVTFAQNNTDQKSARFRNALANGATESSYTPPSTANGVIYYNPTLNAFRAYQNGTWQNLIGGGGSTPPFIDTSPLLFKSVTPANTATYSLAALTAPRIYAWPNHTGNTLVSGGVQPITGTTGLSGNSLANFFIGSANTTAGRVSNFRSFADNNITLQVNDGSTNVIANLTRTTFDVVAQNSITNNVTDAVSGTITNQVGNVSLNMSPGSGLFLANDTTTTINMQPNYLDITSDSTNFIIGNTLTFEPKTSETAHISIGEGLNSPLSLRGNFRGDLSEFTVSTYNSANTISNLFSLSPAGGYVFDTSAPTYQSKMSGGPSDGAVFNYLNTGNPSAQINLGKNISSANNSFALYTKSTSGIVAGDLKININGSTWTMNYGSDATGGIPYRNSSGHEVRLPIGSSGQVLTVVSGLPSWQPAAGGGTPSGVNTELQLNNSGSFGGAGITAASNTLTLGLSTNAATTQSLTTNGSAANVNLNIAPKGNGNLLIGLTGGFSSVNFQNSQIDISAVNAGSGNVDLVTDLLTVSGTQTVFGASSTAPISGASNVEFQGVTVFNNPSNPIEIATQSNNGTKIQYVNTTRTELQYADLDFYTGGSVGSYAQNITLPSTIANSRTATFEINTFGVDATGSVGNSSTYLVTFRKNSLGVWTQIGAITTLHAVSDAPYVYNAPSFSITGTNLVANINFVGAVASRNYTVTGRVRISQ
jgi:hypothetical protein